LYIVIIVFYLKVELIINGNKQKLMIIKELFMGPVGDYCIARNTIKCLFEQVLNLIHGYFYAPAIRRMVEGH